MVNKNGTSDGKEIDWRYFSGFFDADGYIDFGVKIHSFDRVTFNPRLKIGQSKRTAKKTIPALQNFLEKEGIDSWTYEESGKSKNSNYREVSIFIGSQENIEKCLAKMKPYLLNKKEQCIVMLERILPQLRNSKEFTRKRTKEEIIELIYWKERLDSYKGGGVNSKYTVEYFEDKWGMNFTSQIEKLNVDINIGFEEYSNKTSKTTGSIFDY